MPTLRPPASPGVGKTYAMLQEAALRARQGVDVVVGLAEAIREWSQVPILGALGARRGDRKDRGLDAGADDYVTKPFATGELLARIRALLRGRTSPATEKSVLALGDLVVDLAAHTVAVRGEEAKLTRKEFEVLALLARHAGRLVTHKQLLTTVWGLAHAEDAHYLRIAIGHIREKISDDAADPRFILTEPGVGYRMQG
ncbi:MAG: response regulator transcription factor [Devosia sp.]|nr:response regulator transcription factor [Devosia sp.]